MEAVKYFSEKMAYYVEGTNIPIRVIIAYQSLASLEVKIASDYRVRHICDFLLKHPDNFLLTNNNQSVILKNYNDYKPRPYAVRCTSTESTDSEIIKRLLDYLALHAGLKDQPYQNLKIRLIDWSTKSVYTTNRVFTWHESSHINYVCSIQQCEIATKQILDAVLKDGTQGVNAGWPFIPNIGRIAVDCQCITSGSFGEIVLMEIATLDGQVYIFDIKACYRMVGYGLKQILESPEVVKIMHGCRTKSFTIFRHLGITLCNVFDTLSAHEVLIFQKEKPVHRFKNTSYSFLFDHYKVPINLKTFAFKENGQNHDKVWVKRPLPTVAVHLVVAKVSGLLHQRIYPHMCEAILPKIVYYFWIWLMNRSFGILNLQE